MAPWARTGSSSGGSSAALPGFSTGAWKDIQKWGDGTGGASPQAGRGRLAAPLPGTQSTFLAPARRCCRRLRRLRRRSSSRTRGTACGGGWDLGSSDAACLRLAALGRGGGGAPATRPPAGPGRRLGAVPPLALPPPCRRAVSGGLRLLAVQGCGWARPSRRRGGLPPHAERRSRGLGDPVHGSAWGGNGGVWVTLGVGGSPRRGHVAGRRSKLGQLQRRLELKLGKCWKSLSVSRPSRGWGTGSRRVSGPRLIPAVCSPLGGAAPLGGSVAACLLSGFPAPRHASGD